MILLIFTQQYVLYNIFIVNRHEKQLKIFYVGGPNQRKDFHIEEGEELFYMKKGSMDLVVLEHGRFRNLNIGEGEVLVLRFFLLYHEFLVLLGILFFFLQVFLLPGRVPHSPQRQRDTVGLVIERERSADEMDCLRYFVGETTEPLFERWFYCDDLGTQLPPVIREFFASEQCKTGLPIPGTIPEHPPYSPDSLRTLEEPFLLASWLQSNGEEIHSVGSKRLFDNSYQSDIIVYSDSSIGPIEAEIWLWQLVKEI